MCCFQIFCILGQMNPLAPTCTSRPSARILRGILNRFRFPKTQHKNQMSQRTSRLRSTSPMNNSNTPELADQKKRSQCLQGLGCLMGSIDIRHPSGRTRHSRTNRTRHHQGKSCIGDQLPNRFRYRQSRPEKHTSRKPHFHQIAHTGH